MAMDSEEETDPVADLVFFNPSGWLLFSFDGVARFFSEDIKIGFWPGQPSLDFSTFSLYNAGESYFFRGGFDFMGGATTPAPAPAGKSFIQGDGAKEGLLMDCLIVAKPLTPLRFSVPAVSAQASTFCAQAAQLTLFHFIVGIRVGRWLFSERGTSTSSR